MKAGSWTSRRSHPALFYPLIILFCFLFLQKGRVEETSSLPGCTTEQHKQSHLCLLTSLPGLGKGNINRHFINLLHISVFFPVLYFIVKARLILLCDGTWVTNSAYLVEFSGRRNNIGSRLFHPVTKPPLGSFSFLFRKLMITLLLVLPSHLRKKMNLNFKTSFLVFASQARHEHTLNERCSAVMGSREIACYTVGTECSSLPWI